MKIMINLLILTFSFSVYSVYIGEEHPGCPENALCNKDAGTMLGKWQKYLTDNHKSAKKMNEYLKEHGVPTLELSAEDEIIQNDILWSSECAFHNKQNPKVLKTLRFKKGSQDSNIKGLTPILLKGEKPVSYYGPYSEAPQYIKNKKLIFIRENEGIYYYQSVDQTGNWHLIPRQLEIIKRSMIENTSFYKCNNTSIQNKFFSRIMCKKIWNADLSALTEIEIGLGC